MLHVLVNWSVGWVDCYGDYGESADTAFGQSFGESGRSIVHSVNMDRPKRRLKLNHNKQIVCFVSCDISTEPGSGPSVVPYISRLMIILLLKCTMCNV